MSCKEHRGVPRSVSHQRGSRSTKELQGVSKSARKCQGASKMPKSTKELQNALISSEALLKCSTVQKVETFKIMVWRARRLESFFFLAAPLFHHYKHLLGSTFYQPWATILRYVSLMQNRVVRKLALEMHLKSFRLAPSENLTIFKGHIKEAEILMMGRSRSFHNFINICERVTLSQMPLRIWQCGKFSAWHVQDQHNDLWREIHGGAMPDLPSYDHHALECTKNGGTLYVKTRGIFTLLVMMMSTFKEVITMHPGHHDFFVVSNFLLKWRLNFGKNVLQSPSSLWSRTEKLYGALLSFSIP